MSDSFSMFRALVIYGLCLPLAILLGYMLATPDDRVSDITIMAVFGLLAFPLLLRWHHPLLVLSWNLLAVLPVAGKPQLFLPVCAMSLMIAILQYTLNKNLKFISAPTIAWPLLTLSAIVLITARLTGGIGLNIAGGGGIGGRRYIWLLSAVAGYFALTSQRIPAQKVMLYIRMYFLSGLTSAIGLLITVVAPSFYFIFLIFPPEQSGIQAISTNVSGADDLLSRFSGLSTVGTAINMTLLATFGIRGILNLQKPWRLTCFLFFLFLGMLGGFRSGLILILLQCSVMFYFEGLMRSRMLPVILLLTILGGAVVLPFANKLPLSIQRTISFLPIQVDTLAAMDAQGSTEWRLQMWQRVLPEVPKYLFLGKGYSIDPGALEMAVARMTAGQDPWEGSMLSGDYHSGPLSAIIPFGIWGALAFLWFLYASIKALYQNHLYGDPEFKTVNTFLLAAFITKTIGYFFIFGSLFSDLLGFTGMIGLSVCINGGVRSAVPVVVVKTVFNKFKLANATR